MVRNIKKTRENPDEYQKRTCTECDSLIVRSKTMIRPISPVEIMKKVANIKDFTSDPKYVLNTSGRKVARCSPSLIDIPEFTRKIISPAMRNIKLFPKTRAKG
jgi:hypothetical protein